MAGLDVHTTASLTVYGVLVPEDVFNGLGALLIPAVAQDRAIDIGPAWYSSQTSPSVLVSGLGW